MYIHRKPPFNHGCSWVFQGKKVQNMTHLLKINQDIQRDAPPLNGQSFWYLALSAQHNSGHPASTGPPWLTESKQGRPTDFELQPPEAYCQRLHEIEFRTDYQHLLIAQKIKNTCLVAMTIGTYGQGGGRRCTHRTLCGSATLQAQTMGNVPPASNLGGCHPPDGGVHVRRSWCVPPKEFVETSGEGRPKQRGV